MINIKKLYRKLYKRYPYALAKKNHDFVGVMVSRKNENIKKIVLCLDLDEEVYSLSSSFAPDLIITHHPFLYGRSKVKVLRNDVHKANLNSLLKNQDIGVFSLHTNFDEASNGMNDVLSSLLDLQDVYSPYFCPMMRVGYLKEELDIIDFVKYAKDKLNVKYALLTHYGKDKIKKVGILGGGGASYYKYAQDEQCDIFISGDAAHHTRRDITNDKFNYLEVPHEVERVFMNKMKDVLLEIDPDLEILIIDHEQELKVF